VFNGEKLEPYLESDPISPMNVCGASKAAGAAIAELGDRYLLLRTSRVYGARGKSNGCQEASQFSARHCNARQCQIRAYLWFPATVLAAATGPGIGRVAGRELKNLNTETSEVNG
jgi:dTDP-4-dehydrorhamnose reductase